MNVYDFDKTIIKYDSSYLFIKFMLRRHPKIFYTISPRILAALYKYLLNKDIIVVKENIFSFLKYIPNIDEYIDEFWCYAEQYIQEWYLKQKKYDDVIISASPNFLLKPVAKKYGFILLATDMDKFSGHIMGLNTKGTEKVIRFRETFGNSIIDEFYSDSLSDQPLADISRKAFLVCGTKLKPWPNKYNNLY